MALKKMFGWREKKGRQKDKPEKKHSGLRGYMSSHATNIRSGKSFTDAWRRFVNMKLED